MSETLIDRLKKKGEPEFKKLFAERASKDAQGRVIADTYATKEEVEASKTLRILGVTGLGGSNKVLTRTYDAVGKDWSKIDNGQVIEFSSPLDGFFKFTEDTDSEGNVFVWIPSFSFRKDQVTSDGEIVAYSVKHSDDKDEEEGFERHPFFYNYVNETKKDPVPGRWVAKYKTGFNDNSNPTKLTSKPGTQYYKVAKTIGDYISLAKNSASVEGDYNICNWMFASLMRLLIPVYFGRLDLFDVLKNDGHVNGYDMKSQSGSTSSIQSVCGINKVTCSNKIFGFEDLISGIPELQTGIYMDWNSGKLCYSNLFEANSVNDESYIQSDIDVEARGSDSMTNVITKVSTDSSNWFLSLPTASAGLLGEAEAEYDNEGDGGTGDAYRRYYCSKYYLYGDTTYPKARSIFMAFGSYNGGMYDGDWPSLGLWSLEDRSSGDALAYWAARLCKRPE